MKFSEIKSGTCYYVKVKELTLMWLVKTPDDKNPDNTFEGAIYGILPGTNVPHHGNSVRYPYYNGQVRLSSARENDTEYELASPQNSSWLVAAIKKWPGRSFSNRYGDELMQLRSFKTTKINSYPLY